LKGKVARIREVVRGKLAMVRKVVKGRVAVNVMAGTILDKGIATYWVLCSDETMGCREYWCD
jgi:hypothetical protein